MAIDRVRQAARTRCHCSTKRNCVSLCIRMSRAERAVHRLTAAGSRCAISGSHSVQASSPCAAFTAMNSAKSSSHAACTAQKRSNRSRMAAGAVASNRSRTRGQSACRWASTRGSRRRPGRSPGGRRRPAPSSRPSRDQIVEADEQRVAREGREALIRRVAVAGGAERQHLPEALAGRGQRIDEVESAGAEVADAEAARQGRRVEEHAARAGKGIWFWASWVLVLRSQVLES